MLEYTEKRFTKLGKGVKINAQDTRQQIRRPEGETKAIRKVEVVMVYPKVTFVQFSGLGRELIQTTRAVWESEEMEDRKAVIGVGQGGKGNHIASFHTARAEDNV